MWHGFVTIGRAELLIGFVAVALLMALLGYCIGQIVMMSKAPEPCTKRHADEMWLTGTWLPGYLRRNDFSLITNEMLATTEFAPYGKHSRQAAGGEELLPLGYPRATASDAELLESLRGALERWDVS